MYAATVGAKREMGGTDLEREAGHHCPPAGDGPVGTLRSYNHSSLAVSARCGGPTSYLMCLEFTGKWQVSSAQNWKNKSHLSERVHLVVFYNQRSYHEKISE